MVSRRAFLYGSMAAMAAPRTVDTQQTGRIYRIGFLRNGPPPETFVEGLRKGLRELGYVEGQNISIEYGLARSADELPSAAARLGGFKVERGTLPLRTEDVIQ